MKLKIFYLYIEEKNDKEKRYLAEKLKKISIFPLPLEQQKDIYKKGVSEVDCIFDGNQS